MGAACERQVAVVADAVFVVAGGVDVVVRVVARILSLGAGRILSFLCPDPCHSLSRDKIMPSPRSRKIVFWIVGKRNCLETSLCLHFVL